MSRSPLIRLDGYGLSFPVLHGSARSLKKTLFRQMRGAVGGKMQAGDVITVQALEEVSFTLRPGERVGLIGYNGAGKSTLLRALAGIYESDVGVLDVRGRLHALLDPQAGMSGELTGRENIYLFARMLGFDRAATRQLETDVEVFAELGAFLDLPVALYSSGMAVRLGFGLATAPRPQILLMDEWFMAGDQHFQDRAQGRLEEMVAAADIMVLTSHSLPVMRKWCTRILWLEHGRVRMDGGTDAVLDAYEANTEALAG
ncbi:ABC transporter ATP-binding protein [Acidomonas methanolica]|uniref:ABC transporter ATP-binding protein n=1 Tax=Acidomonas methanolica TaxID=437 RepID=UPI002119EE75|nr:ABC transporter ATP-binding protein [Acidomonas methanolica]MCQ9156143.1 ABC transporter ATP-binding protein [Acidomonas methanolica]